MRFGSLGYVGWVSAPQTLRDDRGLVARNPTHRELHGVGLRANGRTGRGRQVLGALTQPTVLVFVLALLTSPSLAFARPLKIVASFSILADMVSQVAGPHAEVIALVGPGGDAHTFDPSPADAAKLTGADLIVVNGLGFDGWMLRLAQAAGTTAGIVTASTDVTPLPATEAGEGVPDPHAWQDPRNGGLYVRAIEVALTRADPAHAADFTANADKFISELDEIDGAARKQLSGIAQNRRKIITSHDAFGYFGRAYGVTMLAPEGSSTEQEPSVAAVARLIDQIRTETIGAVFLENMANPKLIETIRRDTGAADGGTLYSDSTSPPDGPAPTYLTMLRYNIGKLVAAMTRAP